MAKRKYSRPELSNNRVIYQSPRYTMFEVNAEHPYMGYEKFCTVIVWDGAWDGYLSFGDLSKDGEYTGELGFSGYGCEITPAKTPREFIDNAKAAADFHFKVLG